MGAVSALGELADAAARDRPAAESQVDAVRRSLDALTPSLRSTADAEAHAAALSAVDGARDAWPVALEQAYRRLRAQAVHHAPEARALPRRVSPHNPYRSAFHAGAGLAAALIHRYVLAPELAFAVAVALSALGLVLELTRRNIPWFNARVMGSGFVRRVSRADEHQRIWSSTYFAWGVTGAMLFAPPLAVQLACVVLGFGDPAASIVGRSAGGPKLLEAKSVGGSLGFLCAGTGFGVIFLLSTSPLPPAAALGLAAAASAAGALAELASRTIDDNLTIPLAAALAATLVLL